MAFTIYLTGQNNFGNRGCEALVRSAVATLNDRLGDVRFLVPSNDIPRDSAQWPDAASSGVRFVPAPQVPASYKWWGRLCRVCPPLKHLRWPSLKNLPNLEEYLSEADAVISIGGDNYSLDYGPVSLFFFVEVGERAIELGKATALWGASVGPFSADSTIERLLVGHLRKLDMVSVRESHSVSYLRHLGLTDNVVPVADSAFGLQRERLASTQFLPKSIGDGIVGINVSEVLQLSLSKFGKTVSVIDETRSFIEHLLHKTSYSILLIPHVSPLIGSSFNNDEVFLQQLFDFISGFDERIAITPRGLNCCELKEVISHCRFFIGARTHATIASLSTGIPTLSIAYSIKAKGINFDLFGNENYVLPTGNYCSGELDRYFSQLEKDEEQVKTLLSQRIPLWQKKATISAQHFSTILLSKTI